MGCSGVWIKPQNRWWKSKDSILAFPWAQCIILNYADVLGWKANSFECCWCSLCRSCSFFSCLEKCVWLWCMEKCSWCLSSFLLVSSWHSFLIHARKTRCGLLSTRMLPWFRNSWLLAASRMYSQGSLCVWPVLMPSLGSMRSQDSLLDGPGPTQKFPISLISLFMRGTSLNPSLLHLCAYSCFHFSKKQQTPTAFKISHHFVYAFKILHQCLQKH